MENVSIPGPEDRANILNMFAWAYGYFVGNDIVTLGHCKRCMKVGQLIFQINGLCFGLPPDESEYALFLHDVGKITVPGKIIKSRKRFSSESPEMQLIKNHPLNGADLMWNLPDSVKDLARYHHEDYDGKGYPFCLKGEDIPEAARMMAIIDSLDAILSERPYKKGETLREALKKIQDGAGSRFDPDLVDMVNTTMQTGGALVDNLILRHYPHSLG